MENIVQKVSLSKGGVYRLYPSTTEILKDLMIEGMRLRNAFYEQQVQQRIAAGQPLTLAFLVEMICDSLLLYPDFSAVYVEFLWEKQRSSDLQQAYQQICAESIQETLALMQRYGADRLLQGHASLETLTELMNAAILSLRILNLQEFFAAHKADICAAITRTLENETN